LFQKLKLITCELRLPFIGEAQHVEYLIEM
jgi:hypothetical protein